MIARALEDLRESIPGAWTGNPDDWGLLDYTTNIIGTMFFAVVVAKLMTML